MKILLIHASAGAGHQKACEAVYNGIRKYTHYTPTLVDGLDYAHPFFKTSYAGSYKFLITYVPWLWGIFFAILDIPFLQPLIRGWRRLYNGLNFKKLERYMIEENFDFIISTHFMPNEIASSLKRQGKIFSRIISVVTDYDVHRIWLAPRVDTFVCATEWTKDKIVTLGIDAANVVVTGIPTDEKFAQPRDVGELKRQLGVHENMFTVLVATGSFGIGPIEEIIKSLNDFQVLVICGHNKKLYARLTTVNYPHAKVFSYVDNMPDLMAVCDAMITKPGGLSISEALVCQLPLIFFNAIPGQETNNIKVLNHYGVGITGDVKEIASKLKTLNSSRDELRTAFQRTKALARPNAVRDIIALIK